MNAMTLNRLAWPMILLALVAGCDRGAPSTPVASVEHTPTAQPVAPSPTPELAVPAFRIVGYVTDGGIVASPEQIARLTHINYAFALPKADGTLLGPANKWKLEQYVDTAHAQGVKVLISVGGWGYDPQFEQLAAAPETRATFVAEVMRLVDDYNLDGADIDWEYPDAGESSRNFTTLMNELRAELDARGKLLTAAVVALGPTAEGVAAESVFWNSEADRFWQ
jgi:GH18 family chitinase